MCYCTAEYVGISGMLWLYNVSVRILVFHDHNIPKTGKKDSTIFTETPLTDTSNIPFKNSLKPGWNTSQ